MVKTSAKPFAALTANDVMSRPVEAIPTQMSLREAARLLRRSQISGAPVVDCEGRCVGVLSATDFVRAAEGGEKPRNAVSYPQPFVCSEWQMVDLEVLPNEEVGAHMTADPVTAREDTRITELASMLLDAHIHRVVIVDRERRPVGIVSSTDILGAVVRMGRKQTQE